MLFLALLGAGLVIFVFYHYGKDLPDYAQLADYDPPTVTRVHAGDGHLLTEYATQRRVFVPIQAIPDRVINAFLSAEDKNFYDHGGIDLLAVFRAALVNVKNLGSGRRLVGASTITQQVAKNFLLTNEVSYERKIREAIIALRIEKAFDKDRILELYLNEIYLGQGSYGVAAAALNYFNKSLDELDISEAAYLAALPKAPNNYNPVTKYDAAVARRNWVIERLEDDGHISAEEAAAAASEELVTVESDPTEFVQADFFVEEVRRELARLYGDDALYEGGLSVRTTLDPVLQRFAEQALRDGLIAYDRRHGWRGPLVQLDLAAPDWQEVFDARELPGGAAPWKQAVVLSLSNDSAAIRLQGGSDGIIPLAEMTWARPWLEDQKVGAEPKTPGDVLAPGDVVLVEPVTADADGKDYPESSHALRQMPNVNGALVSLDPHTGRVLAMAGGFSFAQSEFNRATQAWRQPGSAFKPFVYLSAMDSGFTPSTIVLDAPYVVDQGPGKPKWKPDNYTHRFYGPTPLRQGIEKSRNLMTIRLAHSVGMEKISRFAENFGITDHMPEVLAMALGSGETTLLRLTAAYGMLVNGGKRISPSLIDRVQDKQGRTLYRFDDRGCPACSTEAWRGQKPPRLPDTREQVADPASVYQVVSMLQGVVQRGTGRRIAELGKPLAGKTGTTNESRDTWFLGFSPDLVTGVFVGFDEPKPLGAKETGSSVAAPIFKSFMAKALEDRPAVPFRVPRGIQLVRVNRDTGLPARAGDNKVILEAFKPGTLPTGNEPVVDGGYSPGAGEGGTARTAGKSKPVINLPAESGGLY